ncbi:T9SS type A sorting domain-containing protein [bacterium]|nr:T9SS type A sorting domain-containing protein [bacterium]
MFRSDNFGAQWINISNNIGGPDCLNENPRLILSATNNRELFIINSSEIIYHTMDAGETWERMYSDSVNFLLHVDPRNPDLMIARKYLSTPYLNSFVASTDGGQTWQDRSSGIDTTMGRLLLNPNPFFHDHLLAFQPAGHGSDVISGHLLYASSDFGLHWRKISSLDSTQTETVVTFDSQNPSIFYVRSFASASGVLKTTDAGTTWEAVGNGLPAPPSFGYRLTVDPSRSNVVYAHDGTDIYRSTNGGNDFSVLSAAPSLGRINTITIDPIDSMRLYVGAVPTGVWFSNDGGISWEAQSNGLTISDVAAFSCLSKDSIFALVHGKGLLRTTNGGGDWETLLPDPSSSEASMILVQSDGEHAIYSTRVPSSWYGSTTAFDTTIIARSTDAGTIWEQLHIPHRSVSHVGVSSDRQVMYADFSAGVDSTGSLLDGLIRSSDAGNTWEILQLPGYRINSVRNIIVDPVNSDRVYATVIALPSASLPNRGSLVIRSDDGGKSWTTIADTIYGFVVRPRQPHILFHLSSDEHHRRILNRSSDYGATWERIAVGYKVRDIVPHPLHVDMLYGVTDPGRITYSTDGGASWREVESSGSCKGLLQVAPVQVDSSSFVLFGSTSYGGLKVYQGDVVSSITVENQPLDIHLGQSYPNPTHSGSTGMKTTIPFSLDQDGYVRLVIHDIMGRRVRTIVNHTLSAGVHHAEIDIKGLRPGIYYYTLTANSQTATKTLVVVR